VADEWLTDDLPVLHAVRDLEEESEPGIPFTAAALAERVAFDQKRTIKLLTRLARADYIDGQSVDTMAGILDYYVDGLTERGRRAVGQWPSNDPWAGLVELLSTQIEAEQDDERRTRLVKLRDGVLSAGRGVGIALFTKFLEQQAGLG